jgi:Protein of unknown function (DUF3604)
MIPSDIFCVVPSRVAVGEPFSLQVKVLGETRILEVQNFPFRCSPSLHGPFNLAVARDLPYVDNCLPEWQGRLQLDGGPALEGPSELVFDGSRQGVFFGDTRPIATFPGLRWTTPGFHFLRVSDPASGVKAWANAVCVTPEPPAERLYWGDPHWQTFFSDGLRCPEELYAFARDEGFLDFGAISDHMEAITDRQWDYFTAVTNDYNEDGRFATLVGQEWTNSELGHRNVYYRGAGGPVLRSDDPDCNTLDKLWHALEGLEALAIPHHSASHAMGVDWSLGWNPEFEKAVEIYSVWGSSENSAAAGNPRPIRALQGEAPGRHVLDALKAGYRMGFVGGGDIHDGRPGLELAHLYPPATQFRDDYPGGYTAALTPALTLRNRRTYATTQSRIYLDTEFTGAPDCRVTVQAASEEGLAEAAVIRNGEKIASLIPDAEPRVVQANYRLGAMAPEEYCYVRVVTQTGEMAWSSPVWGEEL